MRRQPSATTRATKYESFALANATGRMRSRFSNLSTRNTLEPGWDASAPPSDAFAEVVFSARALARLVSIRTFALFAVQTLIRIQKCPLQCTKSTAQAATRLSREFLFIRLGKRREISYECEEIASSQDADSRKPRYIHQAARPYERCGGVRRLEIDYGRQLQTKSDLQIAGRD